jgi:hypothetical protein
MLLSPDTSRDITPGLIEGSLTAIFFVVAFIWPKLGCRQFSRIEHAFSRLARKKGMAVAAVGISAFLLRLAILPLFPIPLPFVPDDFSFLLAADTFAHGRLTNPTPAMWTHLESIHISMQPTYMSMYFPAQGLVMAASQVLFGNPWWCQLITCALMCAAICWMLQAWLPPTWALLGGVLAILRLGLFSYWINTFTGAALITAFAGALVLGALPRLTKTARLHYGWPIAVGMILLALTRPYEGVLLCLPVAGAMGRWAFFGKNRPAPGVLLRSAALPLTAVLAALAFLGYYDYRAFGNPLTLPYTINRATYALTPYYIWQKQRVIPPYRHKALRDFFSDPDKGEYSAFVEMQTLPGYIHATYQRVWTALTFFAGGALLIPLIMTRRVFLDRRIRFLILCLLVLMAGIAIEIYMIPHYLGPFTVVFYAIGLQAMRHLRVWTPEGKPVGLTLTRLAVSLCVLMAGLRLFAEPLHMKVVQWPVSAWSIVWYGPNHFGTERARVQSQLEQQPGKQLILVRYAPEHPPIDEWVYNLSDIDGSKVIWAREMSAADNTELLRYYHDRKVWLVEPDTMPAKVTPYPVPAAQ